MLVHYIDDQGRAAGVRVPAESPTSAISRAFRRRAPRVGTAVIVESDAGAKLGAWWTVNLDQGGRAVLAEARGALRNPGATRSSFPDRFASYAGRHGFTRDEADRIFTYYRRAKLITIDPATGGWNFVHGAFGDPDVMARALAEERRSGRQRRNPRCRRCR